MTIKDWPEGERPRERLRRLGPQALATSELLAILLRVGVSVSQARTGSLDRAGADVLAADAQKLFR